MDMEKLLDRYYWILMLFISLGRSTFAAYGFGGFPLLPWLTVPQRNFNRPIPLPNPQIFAQGPASDQATSFAAYRWDMFYLHTDPPVTPASVAVKSADTTASPSGNPLPSDDSDNNDKTLAANSSSNPFNLVTADPGQRGGQACRSTTLSSPSGSKFGVCVNVNNFNKECRSKIRSESPTCRFFQKCCLNI